MRGSVLAVDTAVSSVRPPWLLTMTPATCSAAAWRASSGCRMPLSSTGSRVMDCSQATSSQVGAWLSRPSKRALWPGPSACVGRGGQAVQVDRADAGRQPEAGAAFAVTRAVAGRVHGQHQGLVTRALGTLHQFAGEAASCCR
jgi:hypothetical protein